jgi:acyl-CoA thioesterase
MTRERPIMPILDGLDDLRTASHIVPSGAGFTWEVPDGWQQGRGAFGGLVLGALVRAMEAAQQDPARTLRGLSAELCAPALVGPAAIQVDVLRRGNGVTTCAARLHQEGEVRASATAVFGQRRSQDRAQHLAAPQPPPWREVGAMPADTPFIPRFAAHFEYRPCGPPPFQGGTEARASGWIRQRRPSPSIGPLEIVALADAWWPAQFSVETMPRPMATLSFSLQLGPGTQGLSPEAPLYHRASVLGASEGFVIESRELWTEDGALVAHNQQLFVAIR